MCVNNLSDIVKTEGLKQHDVPESGKDLNISGLTDQEFSTFALIDYVRLL